MRQAVRLKDVYSSFWSYDFAENNSLESNMSSKIEDNITLLDESGHGSEIFRFPSADAFDAF